MQPKPVSTTLSVSPQITPDDIEEVRNLGFRSIICNRPDGEEAAQPTFDEIEAAATAIGMPARYIPIIPGRMSETDASAFRAALEELPGPVLAYCRSGARSATLWSLSQTKP